jgi:hypothetical protein
MNFGLPGGVEFFKNAAVLSKDSVHIPNIVIRILLESVVIRIAALIRAKLFIRPSGNFIAAFRAFLLFHPTLIKLKFLLILFSFFSEFSNT